MFSIKPFPTSHPLLIPIAAKFLKSYLHLRSPLTHLLDVLKLSTPFPSHHCSDTVSVKITRASMLPNHMESTLQYSISPLLPSGTPSLGFTIPPLLALLSYWLLLLLLLCPLLHAL